MKIAVLSDSHDNIWKLADAMTHLQKSDVVIHCGDLCSPFMIKRLGEGLGEIPLHIVWGNNDGDTFLLTKVAGGFPSITLHGALAQIEIDGLKVAVNHYPNLARGLALSGQYDVVCYGHDHTARQEQVAGCLFLNPGELMGMNGRSTIAFVDSEGRQVEFVEV